MRFAVAFLLITAMAGFDVLLIPTPERIQVPTNFLNDETCTGASQCSALSLMDMEIDPNSEEFCVLQSGANKKQRKDFNECLEELGDCDKSSRRNSQGDYLVECKVTE